MDTDAAFCSQPSKLERISLYAILKALLWISFILLLADPLWNIKISGQNSNQLLLQVRK